MPKPKRKSPLTTILLLAGAGAGGYALWRMSKGESVLPDVLLPGEDTTSPTGPSNPGTTTRMTTKTTTRTTPGTTQAVTVKRNWIAARFALQKGMQGDVVGLLQLSSTTNALQLEICLSLIFESKYWRKLGHE